MIPSRYSNVVAKPALLNRLSSMPVQQLGKELSKEDYGQLLTSLSVDSINKVKDHITKIFENKKSRTYYEGDIRPRIKLGKDDKQGEMHLPAYWFSENNSGLMLPAIFTKIAEEMNLNILTFSHGGREPSNVSEHLERCVGRGLLFGMDLREFDYIPKLADSEQVDTWAESVSFYWRVKAFMDKYQLSRFLKRDVQFFGNLDGNIPPYIKEAFDLLCGGDGYLNDYCDMFTVYCKWKLLDDLDTGQILVAMREACIPFDEYIKKYYRFKTRLESGPKGKRRLVKLNELLHPTKIRGVRLCSKKENEFIKKFFSSQYSSMEDYAQCWYEYILSDNIKQVEQYIEQEIGLRYTIMERARQITQRRTKEINNLSDEYKKLKRGDMKKEHTSALIARREDAVDAFFEELKHIAGGGNNLALNTLYSFKLHTTEETDFDLVLKKMIATEVYALESVDIQTNFEFAVTRKEFAEIRDEYRNLSNYIMKIYTIGNQNKKRHCKDFTNRQKRQANIAIKSLLDSCKNSLVILDKDPAKTNICIQYMDRDIKPGFIHCTKEALKAAKKLIKELDEKKFVTSTWNEVSFFQVTNAKVFEAFVTYVDTAAA